MHESASETLELFADCLQSLATDAAVLGDVVADPAAPEGARRLLAGAVNYVFKSIDLIPDGIDDIGYLDDACVLRIAVQDAMREDLSELPAERLQELDRLAVQGEQVQHFLAADYARLHAYVLGLPKHAVRGRAVERILHDDETRAAFLSDVHGFAQAYRAPEFRHDARNLVRLRAFFDAKLPK